jgi:hypothetical protein
MGSKHRTAVEYDARLGDGAHNRHRCPMPAGRGPSPLLVIDSVVATIVMPFARRRLGLTDADLRAVDDAVAQLTELAERQRLPGKGAWWLTADGPVRASDEPSWLARQVFDRESLQVRLPP